MSFLPARAQKLNLIGADGLHPLAHRAQATAPSASSAPFIGQVLPYATPAFLAIVGWLLYAWYRRRDHRRADLTETAETLGRLDLEARRLAAAGRALTTADFTDLRGLLLCAQRAADRCVKGRRLRSLRSMLIDVSTRITVYADAATAASNDVEAAYMGATSVVGIPPHLLLTEHVARAQQQTRAAEQLLSTVHVAEDKVKKLRAW
ncbi:hypothetical protein [Streptomyces sp. H39-C1]|uniref:hypothetical protein n=1 Tax=Streptomyces sp. H39-C1 TaxID=3004355 RepID=UPI0022B079BF|nr:hypothetical protein [Streptomyces sp. H39-C1]MCZ4101946.1 hypothetical protein [Streptomyces sp. H39-C1]